MSKTLTPSGFERLVADDFRRQGYDIELRGGTGDWGVDLFATRPSEKLAIQAKMYAGSRPVNRRQVFELYGAAAFFGCSGCVIATDGVLMPDAEEAATRLGIRVWTQTAKLSPPPSAPSPFDLSTPARTLPPFDDLWTRWVLPLEGKTLHLGNGGTNRITKVDWSGIGRISSTGRRSSIPIEPFVWAIDRIRERGFVTRVEINEQFEGRFSSGVFLILQQIAELEFVPGDATLRPAHKARVTRA